MKTTQPVSSVRRKLVLAPLGLAGLSAIAQGSDWPGGKVIRILSGVSAGGAPDIVARALAPQMARSLGVPAVIVENRPGAGGTIAAGQLVSAPPDGHTLLVSSSAHAVNPAFYPHLPYDTLRDITAIGPVGSSMFVMVTTEEKGYKSVADVVAKARAHPGKLNYGSGGAGSASHLNSAKLAAATRIDAVHIPFRGAPEAVTELVAGRLDWVFLAAPNALPLLRSGRVKALAVCRTWDLCQLRADDLKGNKLVFPAEVIKTKEPRVVPLPADVAADLAKLSAGKEYLWGQYTEDARRFRPRARAAVRSVKIPPNDQPTTCTGRPPACALTSRIAVGMTSSIQCSIPRSRSLNETRPYSTR